MAHSEEHTVTTTGDNSVVTDVDAALQVRDRSLDLGILRGDTIDQTTGRFHVVPASVTSTSMGHGPLRPPALPPVRASSPQLRPVRASSPPLRPASSPPPPPPAIAVPRVSHAPRVSQVAMHRAPKQRVREPRIVWGRVIFAGAAVAGVVAGVLSVVGRDRSPAAPPPNVVAVLPFENRSHDAALGYAALGLASAVAEQLAGTTVLDVRGPDSSAADATTIVQGALDDDGGAIRIRVEVRRRAEPPALVLDRRAAPAEVAAALRTGVPAFAGVLVDSRDLAGYVERGRRELLDDRLEAAARSLDTVLLHAPAYRDARYLRAITAAVAGGAPEPAVARIDEALADPIRSDQRDALAAYRLLAEVRVPDSIDAFARLAQRRPSDLDVLLGLFEAQLRGGRPAEAAATYGKLHALEPRIRTGLADVLAYAVAHPELRELAWARPLLGRDPRSHALLARELVADRDYRGAAALIANLDGLGHSPAELAAVRAQLALAGDRFDDALAALAGQGTAYRIALAYARGDRTGLARELAPERLAAIDAASPAELDELAAVAAGLDHAALRGRVLHALDRQPAWRQRTAAHQLARSLLGAQPAVAYPEAVAVAQAIAAERGADPRAAEKAWRTAGATSLDGRSLAIARYGVARALLAAGDRSGAVAACGDAIDPRRLQAQWGLAVGDCLAWSAIDAFERGDRAAALGYAHRLALLRPSPLDPLRRRILALLVQ